MTDDRLDIARAEPAQDIGSEDNGGETPAPPPVPDCPVTGGERILTLDLLRGFAVLGILLINMWTFAFPFPAAIDPNLTGFATAPDKLVHAFVILFGHTKMMPIFGMLFGAGIILFTARVEAKGGRSGRRWFARQWWLWVIGLLHGYLLWNGDILVPYAVVGLILYRFRRLRPRTLIILALLAMLVPRGTMYGASVFMEMTRDAEAEVTALEANGEEITGQQEQFAEIWRENSRYWAPDEEATAEIAATMRGGYGDIFARNGTELLTMQFFMYPLGFGWNIAGLMLVGMALFKTGVLQGQRSDRFYVTLAVVGYGLGLPGAWFGLRYLEAHFTDVILMIRYGFAIPELSGPLVALGHIGVVILAARRGWLGGLADRLSAAGRMAFTNYLAQTVIGVTLFYGYGFGLFGTMGRLPALGLTVAVWALQLLWSPWWLARFRFGPAEWAWRSLTYRSRQPLRKPWRRSSEPPVTSESESLA